MLSVPTYVSNRCADYWIAVLTSFSSRIDFSSHANQLLRTYHHKKGWEEVCNVILTGSNTSLCLDVIKCRADVDEATYGGRDRVLLEPAPTSDDRRGLKREYPTV